MISYWLYLVLWKTSPSEVTPKMDYELPGTCSSQQSERTKMKNQAKHDISWGISKKIIKKLTDLPCECAIMNDGLGKFSVFAVTIVFPPLSPPTVMQICASRPWLYQNIIVYKLKHKPRVTSRHRMSVYFVATFKEKISDLSCISNVIGKNANEMPPVIKVSNVQAMWLTQYWTFQESNYHSQDKQLCSESQSSESLNIIMERSLLLLSLISTCYSFNIDTKSLMVQKGPRDTCDDCMFGFSVAQHKEAGVPWWVNCLPS